MITLDSDLALLYGVETKQFNRAVQRNASRFPLEFSFVLDRKELRDLKCQIGTSKGRGGRRKLPRVFTAPFERAAQRKNLHKRAYPCYPPRHG
ncbi:MAG: ORF6N domain-containing protein [Chthoniobacteraceae bacterium]